MLTAIFVYVILAVTDERNEHPALAPLAIGLTLDDDPLRRRSTCTGTSVNPARSIGVGAVRRQPTRSSSSGCSSSRRCSARAIAGLAYPLLFGRGADPVPGSGLQLRPAARRRAVPGYGAPDQYQQEWNQQQTAQDQAAWEQEPIVQDGWQWDHAAQEWKPLEQWQAQQPPAQQAGRAAPPAAGPEPTPALDGGTQIRPPSTGSAPQVRRSADCSSTR